MRERYKLKLPRTTLELGARTAVMGILNITPDSFSDGGQYFDFDRAVARGIQMEQDGADIIDVGGESSRPGSVAVSEEDELRRVLNVIEALAPRVSIPISIDTYRSGVASRATDAGAQIVNDISAFRFDQAMAEVVRNANAGVVLMHSRGSRETLHQQPRMQDAVAEVYAGLAAAAEGAKAAGIGADAIVLDPGIGFGKAKDESVAVLKTLGVFSKLGYPLLVGTSRKSFIRLMTSGDLEARDWGTAATVVASVMNGAHIVRVHDVRQTRILTGVTDFLL